MSPYTSALPVPAQVSSIMQKPTIISSTFTYINNSVYSVPRTDQTILDLLRRRAIQTPDRVCYIFLDDSGNEIRQLTYSQVDDEARRVAAMIQQQKKCSFEPGDRVILCYPPGVDFLIAFWGCLYAGAVACAVYPPHPLHLARDLPRFNRMVHEVGATLVLTNKKYRLQSVLGTLKTQLSFKPNAQK
ncbi:fatty-acid-CoA ligase, partial [Thraustotheca clavata]